MKKKITLQLAATFIIASLFSSCVKKVPCLCDDKTKTPPTVSVFATGLQNPRGLKFGPDGYLYVAEGGKGGTNTTVGQCTQVPAPLGPIKGSPTGGRISKISPSGVRTTVTDSLPSQTTQFGEVSGVADIDFIHNTLYALLTAGGCSHGNPSIPNGVIKVKSDGNWSLFANLSSFLMAHPVKHPEADDFEPDGDWYSMIHVGDNLYAVEANHGELDEISHDGTVNRIAEISATQGHIVPTVVAYRNGNFYVGNLDTFPIPGDASKIFKVTPGGEVDTWAKGFNTILGLTFDKWGNLYVLENTVGAPFPTPGKGQIVKIDTWGNKETIVTGLTLPTGMTFGPDGKLYVSNIGFGPVSTGGGGQVLQIDLHTCKCLGASTDFTY